MAGGFHDGERMVKQPVFTETSDRFKMWPTCRPACIIKGRQPIIEASKLLKKMCLTKTITDSELRQIAYIHVSVGSTGLFVCTLSP